MTRLTILHLYPEELGVFGDVGNVHALTKRAEWRGLDVEVIAYGRGGSLPTTAPDLIHIGNGALSGQRAVYRDVIEAGAVLRSWAADGVPVLAIAAGWQLLGREFTIEAERFDGAGVFSSSAIITGPRKVGNVVGTSAEGQIMGFENHGAVTTLLDGAAPFATGLSRGLGNGDGTEGVLAGESIGTNLGGPLLPLNPIWADRLLRVALERRGEVLPEADAAGADWFAIADEAAVKARAAVADAVAGVNGWLVSR